MMTASRFKEVQAIRAANERFDLEHKESMGGRWKVGARQDAAIVQPVH